LPLELVLAGAHAAAVLQALGAAAPTPKATQAPQNAGSTAPVFPRAVFLPKVLEHAAGPQ
jgi:hypothetical protein